MIAVDGLSLRGWAPVIRRRNLMTAGMRALAVVASCTSALVLLRQQALTLLG